MNWLDIIINVFYAIWAIALLVILWLNLLNNAKKTNNSMQALIDVAKQDSESARQAVEAVRILAAIVQNEQAR